MEEYIINLEKQFFEATGMIADYKTGENFKELREWIKLRQMIGKEYLSFLNFMDLPFDSIDCAEVEKGKLDSIVLPFDTTIITPYSSFPNEANRVIDGRFGILNYTPIVMHQDSMAFDIINPSDIHTFMTQNIYNDSQITGWEDLHNSGNYNIICGAYGEIYDLDIKNKIARLKRLKRNLIGDDYKFLYEESRDRYFYVISSNRTIKRLHKTK